MSHMNVRQGCWSPLTTAVMLLLSAVGSAARASVVIDQSYETPGISGNTIVAARFESAQTFTVGLTGRLTGVDVNIGRRLGTDDPVTITLDVRRTVGGVPVEANAGPDVLTSLTLPASAVPVSNGVDTKFVNFDVPDAAVTRGEVLAIVLRTPAGAVFGAPNDTPFVWAADDPGGYASGRAFARGTSAAGETWGNGGGFSLANTDHEFRTLAIPLPPALATFPACAVLVALATRHRRAGN